MITEPSWGEIARGGRPCIGYAAPCQAVPGCGRADVAERLREELGKVADVVDIWGAPGGTLAACDAVLAMDCAGRLPVPYFIYLCPEQGSVPAMDRVSYEHAVGLFTKNCRLAQSLADVAGVPREKIHVILPAVAGRQDARRIRPPSLREAPRRNLLVCLADYGDQCFDLESVRLVLDAFDMLRRTHDALIRLTISGLENWPLPGSPPDGVTFRGRPLAAETVALFDSHDLLAVPPGLDSDGLPEALSRGVPCVVARASGMAKAITPGVTGAVIGDVNAAELAGAIASVLVDDDIYRSCLERAPAMAAYFSWERVARQVAHVISRELGLMT